MTRPIGYYVHHQGDGHRQRALAIARAAGGAVTLLGTGLAGRTGAIPAVDLADDRVSGDLFDGRDHGDRPASLHYAPTDHDGIRRRVAQISGWIAEARPALMVIDVSVEAAMLARLASVPTVYVRLNGLRDDRPHREAFDAAAALLAPFHAALDDAAIPQAVRRKTFYAPGIVVPTAVTSADPGLVLGVVGRGGGTGDGTLWAEAARSVPERRWRVIGPCSVPKHPPANLEICGWVDDADRMIAQAGIVVGAAGDGLVGSVIANRRPFLCLPEPRPYAEQTSKAARLSALGAAVVAPCWPARDDWRDLLDRAAALDPAKLASLDMTDGAGRAARWLQALADAPDEQRRMTA
ncbi:glycosyltransferase [Sphingomonas abietis]|uniref:Glycosyltransferase n=1 Tax=Sphingomonas abietis TaxID=3012344 RepID=A0ABY7NJ11_9SPHN|nr:glycosyltransferase [Sphingomonas abietis]WBO21520.1 glycosyltransferase [Sphingomonas abietis]